MAPRYRLTREAAQDLSAILIYIAQRNAAAADKLAGRLGREFSRLAERPKSYAATPELGTDLRRSLCKPYLIFFREEKDVISIIAIVHGARDLYAYFGIDVMDEPESDND